MGLIDMVAFGKGRKFKRRGWPLGKSWKLGTTNFIQSIGARIPIVTIDDVTSNDWEFIEDA